MPISYLHFLDEFPPHVVPDSAWETVRDTYALRDENGKPCETFDVLLKRVADSVCIGDAAKDGLRVSIYDLMCRGVFYPNVVFMMNAGTEVRNYGACYLLKPEDSMEGIRDMLDQIIQIQTAGGGCGIDLSNLRAKGELVNSNKGTACGPVAVMKMINAVTDMVKAGGRRRGANICVLSWRHPDIKEFIASKSAIGNLTNVNISVLVSDEFFQSVNNGNTQVLRIFNLICEQAHKTGDPGLLYYGALNRDNPIPEEGDITITNPCGEVCLPPPAACNLGSIDVSKFVSGYGVFDFVNFERTVAVSGSFLREALKSGCYVGKEIQEKMERVKPIGLGIMGFADALIKMKIRYGSDESLEFAEQIVKDMREILKKSFPECGLTMAFAPTGTLSRLANCSSGIEPNYAFSFTRKIETTGQEIKVVHPLYMKFLEGRSSDELLPDYFVATYDVTPDEHVRVLAAFQKHTDGGVSKTVNLSNNTPIDTVKDVFLLAHRLGCKGITVFRDGCREGVLSTTDSKSVIDEVEIQPVNKERRKLPSTCSGIRHKFSIGECEGYIHAGTFEDGSLGEIFLVVSKAGSTIRGMCDSFATAISLGLQYGIPLEALIEKFRHVQFEPSGITGSKDIRFASSIVDYIFTWLEQTFCDTPTKIAHVGSICSKCGSITVHRSGCEDCPTCGWSKCS